MVVVLLLLFVADEAQVVEDPMCYSFGLQRLVRYHLPSVANIARTTPENRVRRRWKALYSPPNWVLRWPRQDAKHQLEARASTTPPGQCGTSSQSSAIERKASARHLEA